MVMSIFRKIMCMLGSARGFLDYSFVWVSCDNPPKVACPSLRPSLGVFICQSPAVFR